MCNFTHGWHSRGNFINYLNLPKRQDLTVINVLCFFQNTRLERLLTYSTFNSKIILKYQIGLNILIKQTHQESKRNIREIKTVSFPFCHMQSAGAARRSGAINK